MVPRLIGQATYQINLSVMTAIASTIAVGSIAIFNFSNNIQYFPVSIIGVSFAIAAFPNLAKAWSANDKERFFNNFSSSLRQTIFMVLPISCLLFIFRAQVVRLILGTGQFGWGATRLTAASLGVFSLGILAASLIPLAARAFFALKNTRTPAIISVGTIGLNISLAFLFTFLLKDGGVFEIFVVNLLKLNDVNDIGVIGLPMALSLSSITQCLLLFYFLLKIILKGNEQDRASWQGRQKEIIVTLVKAAVSSLIAAVVSYLALQLAGSVLNTRTFLGIFAQTTIAASSGVAIYILFSWLLKARELKGAIASVLTNFTK